MPFHPNDLPAPALKAFNKHFKTAALWPIVVDEAVRCGVKDPDTLTDIVFYMHHWNRIGEPIQPHEKQLIAEWKGFRTLFNAGAPKPVAKPGGSGAAASWVMSDTEAWQIQKAWGKDLAEWAKIPPDGTEAKEFSPPSGKDYKTVFAWKTVDARKSCAANPKKRVQLVALLRDDLPYWNKRTGGSRVGAPALQTAARTAIRDYREYIINRKICPSGAFNRLVEVNRDVTFQLFMAMFQLLSPHAAGPVGPKLTALRSYTQSLGNPGKSAVGSVPGLINILITQVLGGEKK